AGGTARGTADRAPVRRPVWGGGRRRLPLEPERQRRRHRRGVRRERPRAGPHAAPRGPRASRPASASDAGGGRRVGAGSVRRRRPPCGAIVTVSPADAFGDVTLDLPGRRTGKVRVSYDLPDDQRLFVTTDRLSAFDRIVARVPYKGQVLNQLAWWWFQV